MTAKGKSGASMTSDSENGGGGRAKAGSGTPMNPAMVHANGVDLCVQSFGDPRAPPLVLIMGLGAQMIAWDDAFCATLAGKGYRVIRFDNRDIGKSSRLDHLGVPNTLSLMGQAALGRPLKVPYTLRDMAADTVGLLDALEIERAHIVGASMGGAIAQELAIHFPARLVTITSIMSSTGDPRLPPPTAEALALLFATAPKERAAFIAHHVKVQRVLRGRGFKEEEAGDADRAARNYDRGINAPGVARQLAAIFASGNRTTALGRVTVPALVLHGDADPLVRVEGGRATAAAIKGAKLEVLPGMGHALPRAVWPRIVDAIAAHTR